MVKETQKIDISSMLTQSGQNEEADGMEMNPNAIPDIDHLTTRVLEFLEFLDTDEMIHMEKTNDTLHRQIINSKFDDIPYSIIKLLIERECRDENLERLIKTFTMLADIKNGKLDMMDGFTTFRDDLQERYLYPQFGGTKESFERAMMDLQNKNKKS